jgi:hypothetical protein
MGQLIAILDPQVPSPKGQITVLEQKHLEASPLTELTICCIRHALAGDMCPRPGLGPMSFAATLGYQNDKVE